MISATFSLVQVLSLLAPGLIFLVVVKDYFPLARALWHDVTTPGGMYGPLIFLLFFALAFGILVQSFTYLISRKILFSHKEIKKINIGRFIKELDGDQMSSIRSIYYVHQTFANMCTVLIAALLKLLIDPTHPSPNIWLDFRLFIIIFFIGTSGAATKESLKSLVGMLASVDAYLTEKRQSSS